MLFPALLNSSGSIDVLDGAVWEDAGLVVLTEDWCSMVIRLASLLKPDTCGASRGGMVLPSAF